MKNQRFNLFSSRRKDLRIVLSHLVDQLIMLMQHTFLPLGGACCCC